MDRKCFALSEENQCNALTVETCPGSTCSFYNTNEQHNESCKKAEDRLAGLNKDRQRYIADKYFKGQMPWQEGR